jgi:alpha/beta superfamily hydrolase
MYPAGNLFIPAPHGRLEAILKGPRDSEVGGVALVLHPHPLGGGTMHNKVVFRAAAALNEAGLVTLRVNFRGVGQSSGTHDEGYGEQDDVRAGLDYLTEKYPGQEITLCGFSFGARVGLEVGTVDESVVRLISIGTPVDKYDFSFLEQCRKPILFVHGENDEYGDVNRLREIVERIASNAPAELRVIDGAGHFFDNQLDELKRVITEWVGAQASLPAVRRHPGGA